MDQLDQAGFAPQSDAHELPFVFTGTAREYFGIWIVNLLLSIVTLGIWSAWAKVRRERWVAGHTILDGSPFEYDARGIQILVGRAIMLLISIAYVVTFHFFPNLIWVPLLVVFIVMPLIVNQSFRFSARVSGWRGVRFDFKGSYFKTLGLIALPIAYVLTLGLVAPLGSRAASRYLAARFSFGGRRFETRPPLKRLYGVLGRTYLLGIVLLIPLALSIAGITFHVITTQEIGTTPEPPPLLILALGASYFLFIFGIIYYYSISVTNIAVNHLTLDRRHEFTSRVSPLRYLWIDISGWIVTALTLGLMHPWAAVRRWRYLTAKRTVIADGELDGFDTGRPRSGRGFFSGIGIFDGVGIGF